MYIGLFLLIPFLNILYANLNSKLLKKRILLTLFILTVFPSIFNIYCLSGLDWWITPSTSSDYFPIVPAWWKNIYPITYFFLGRYLREYPLKIKPFIHILLIIFIFIFAGLFNFYRSYGSTFASGLWHNYGSFFVTIQSVLVFSLFSNLSYENLSIRSKKAFAVVSDLSLGAYLTSWILDQIIYKQLHVYVPSITRQLLWSPIVVTLVFIGSILVSAIIDILYSLFKKSALLSHCMSGNP